MNAPPSKKHRASDDENEQGSPSQREKNHTEKATAAREEGEADGDVARPRRGAGVSPGAIDGDDDDESSEGSLTGSPAAKSKPRAFSLDQASGDSSVITEESFMTWLVNQVK